MPTQIIRVTTDSNGRYQRTDQFDPPGWFSLRVDLRATLVSPADTRIDGIIDLDAGDGNPQNQAQNFTLSTGQQVSLGQWRLDGGINNLSVTGQTSPIRPNTEIAIEVVADVVGF
jgi:hypothetical protein